MTSSPLQNEFWEWFVSVEPDFPATESFDAEFGEELSRRLAKVKDGLVYEISIPPEGTKEIIISADGVKDLIPHVQTLVDVAPEISGWEVVAFRPRMKDYARYKLEYGGRSFDPKEIWFYSRVEDGNFDLILYHPDYSDESRDIIVAGSYILLDMALGEYAVMTGIRYIDHQRLPDNPEDSGLRDFSELREAFDAAQSQMVQ